MYDSERSAIIEVQSFLLAGSSGFAAHKVKVFVDGNCVNTLIDGGSVQLDVEPGEHQVEVRDAGFGVNRSKVITVNVTGGESVDLRLSFNKSGGNMFLIQLVLFWIFFNLQKAAVYGVYFTDAIFAMAMVDVFLISKPGAIYNLHSRADFRG